MSTLPPPLQRCWENVKKCQNFTYGNFDKNSKNTIINRETVFTKIFKKTRTYWDFDENFQKFAGHLRVKEFLNNSKSMIHSRKNTAVKTYWRLSCTQNLSKTCSWMFWTLLMTFLMVPCSQKCDTRTFWSKICPKVMLKRYEFFTTFWTWFMKNGPGQGLFV